MPLEVKDISWSETEQYIVLNVPLKGAAVKNVDIFSTNYYIKVSYPPYFFELALAKEIDDDTSNATVSTEQVTFHLKKVVVGVWGELYSAHQKEKLFMKNLREEAVKYRQEREVEKEKQRSVKKDKEKKFAVREQMRIDDVEMEERKTLKNKEAEYISKDMERWKDENAKPINELLAECTGHSEKENKKNSISSMSSLNKKHYLTNSNNNATCEIKNDNSIQSITNNHNKNKPPLTNSNKNAPSAEDTNNGTEKNKSVPPPRSCGSIQVSFTERTLTTPARESKRPEEELWLSKVAEFSRMKNTDNEDATDIEEMNPIWLKDKGNDFYKKGNVVAAINAYTSALMLDPKIPMIYANRAACHLSLKQYRECIQDCTAALELYNPPVDANVLQRCRALTRRGTAHFEREDYVDALRDYEDAVKLDPKNEALRNDSARIRNIIQGCQ